LERLSIYCLCLCGSTGSMCVCRCLHAAQQTPPSYGREINGRLYAPAQVCSVPKISSASPSPPNQRGATQTLKPITTQQNRFGQFVGGMTCSRRHIIFDVYELSRSRPNRFPTVRARRTAAVSPTGTPGATRPCAVRTGVTATSVDDGLVSRVTNWQH